MFSKKYLFFQTPNGIDLNHHTTVLIIVTYNDTVFYTYLIQLLVAS